MNRKERTMNKRNFLVTAATLAAYGMLASGCTTTGGASGDPAARRQAGNLSLNSNRITPLDL
jgi:xylose isomerase